MNIESVDDCLRFQSDLDSLQEWCSGRKFSLNAAKCRSLSFNRNKKQIGFDYCIRIELERVEEIKDRGDVETTISKSARVLGFIKRIFRVITLIRHCLYRWSDRILSTWFMSGHLIRSSTRRELSVSNIVC
jgi:hypothetical protein